MSGLLVVIVLFLSFFAIELFPHFRKPLQLYKRKMREKRCISCTCQRLSFHLESVPFANLGARHTSARDVFGELLVFAPITDENSVAKALLFISFYFILFQFFCLFIFFFFLVTYDVRASSPLIIKL